jgi:ABC-type dipeptide/oligopeptide/nickel transport system ATPase component
MSSPLLRIDDLAVSFKTSSGSIPAVDGLSLSVWPDQTVALVGESGCGKSVTALSILRLVPTPPGRFDGGAVHFEGRDLLKVPEKQMLEVRGADIAMIFQEPMTSLNPVYTIGDQIVEAILLHQPVKTKEARQIAVAAMADVGIPEPEKRLRDYPHQFSGGMRQRAMIAMALACEPKLLLADEPTTALDVTIQAQILALLDKLKSKRGMAMILITHDLGVVAENADVVCVMYAGRPVEYARVEAIFEKPLHPYTRGLLASIPRLGEPKHRLTTVDQVVDDAEEFKKLPGHDEGVVPWWPRMKPPEKLARNGARDSVLHEIEPDHWVGCWRTEHLETLPNRPPALTYRRGSE